MKLDRALSILEGKELDATLSHWNLDRHAWPVGESDRRAMLRRSLTDRNLVEERLGQLPSRLRDLLVFVIRAGVWAEPFELKELESGDLPVESFELLPVGTALAERGFMVSARVRGGGRGQTFVIAEELGHLLEQIIDKSRQPVDAALSLKACLRFLDRGRLGRLLEGLDIELGKRRLASVREELCRRESFETRLARIEDDELRECLVRIEDHGGVVDGEARRRLHLEAERDRLEAWGTELEKLLLGTFEHAELTNHGLSCRTGWLVLHHEPVHARFAEYEVDDDEAAADLQRGPDPLADLHAIVHEMEKAPFRVKKNGEYHKAGAKKLQKTALTPGARLRGGEADLAFYLGFLQRQEMIAVSPESRLRATKRWREWDRQGSYERTQDLLKYALGFEATDMSALHHSALRARLLDELREAGVGRWIAAHVVVLRARNEYLAEAVRPEHAQRYQDRHKHAPFPRLAGPDLMQRRLARWIVDGLARIGLVELAVRGRETRPWALRLTRLGGKVLGLKVDDADEQPGAGLIVNPDHEIILFPESVSHDVVQEVGRFALRQKADYALHYAITRESVQKAAASGFGADDILALLEENSRHELPGNVVYSIREWCEKLVRAEARRSWIVETEDAAAMSQLLSVTEFKALVRQKLSDVAVELDEDPGQAGIVAILRDRGIYL